MWILDYPERPWTLNAERNWHHQQRAKKVKQWRQAFCELATAEKIPALETLEIHATPILADRRLQDVANCYPAVKAAIDGLIDAGVVPDDSPYWLKAIHFYAPVTQPGYNALRIAVSEYKPWNS